MNTHTPLPWVAHGCTIAMADNWKDGNNLGGGTVAITYQPDADQCPVDEMIGNAEFIVRAVNSHDTLLAACQEVSNTAQVQEEDGECTGVLITHEAWTWCLEAIAQTMGNASPTPQVSGNLNEPIPGKE